VSAAIVVSEVRKIINMTAYKISDVAYSYTVIEEENI